MKSLAIILVILSFVSIAVFGFLGMNIGHSDCIMKVANGGSICPHDSTLDFIVFHVGALKGFSLAILDFSFLMIAAICLIVSLFLAFYNNLFDIYDCSKIGNFSLFQKIGEFLHSIEKIKLSHWLALSEKRDPSPSL